MRKIFIKSLFYFVPVTLGVIIILLQLFGLSEIWKLLSIVLVLLFGSYMLDIGKAWGCIFGILLGMAISVGGILEIPRRMNMGNAGPRIEPTWENSIWYIWNTEIIWGIVLAIFFVALGIFVLIKNKKQR